MLEKTLLHQSDRLTIVQISDSDIADSFSQDVFNGLSANPKILLPKYFYDELGSYLFEAICCLPEYYVTRDEREIVEHSAPQIIDECQVIEQCNLIELGSGSSDKTRYLIDALLQRRTSLHYLPIDISLTSLEQSTEKLLHVYPKLRITSYAADYFTALRTMAQDGLFQVKDGQRNIVLFLGSSIGNLGPEESNALLSEVRKVLQPGDHFLIGADLKKTQDILLPAYNDALGVTAAFNLNLLVRINRELGGNFNLANFAHRSIYNEQLDRIEMHLFSLQKQVISIEDISLKARFEKGESIHTENSYKFELRALSELADRTGFKLTKTWFDSHKRFSLNCFAAV
jgi:dimethylhistidine N-methyltransferase